MILLSLVIFKIHCIRYASCHCHVQDITTFADTRFFHFLRFVSLFSFVCLSCWFIIIISMVLISTGNNLELDALFCLHIDRGTWHGVSVIE